VVGEKFVQEILARQHEICVLLIRPCRGRLPHPVSSFPCDLLPIQWMSLSPSVTTSALSDATCRRACSMPLFGPAPLACISLTYIQFISMNDIHVISRDICLYPNEISTQNILGISKAFILPISSDIHITYPYISMTAMEVAGVVTVRVTRDAMAASAAWGQTADCSSMAKPQGAQLQLRVTCPGAAHGLRLGLAARPA
jgi:hypothetical protein